MGARVIKIEAPRGDLVRGVQWRADTGWSPMSGHGSAGKESICVDLRKPEGLALVDRLLDLADIVVGANSAPALSSGWASTRAS